MKKIYIYCIYINKKTTAPPQNIYRKKYIYKNLNIKVKSFSTRSAYWPTSSLTSDFQTPSCSGCNVLRRGWRRRPRTSWRAARPRCRPSPGSPTAAPWPPSAPAAGCPACRTRRCSTGLNTTDQRKRIKREDESSKKKNS